MSNIAVSVANELKNKMKTVNLIFPHQLFIQSELVDNDHEIYLLEEYLFFSQYPFHKQKIAFHRASMKTYEKYLKGKGKKYITSRLVIPCLISEILIKKSVKKNWSNSPH